MAPLSLLPFPWLWKSFSVPVIAARVHHRLNRMSMTAGSSGIGCSEPGFLYPLLTQAGSVQSEPPYLFVDTSAYSEEKEKDLAQEWGFVYLPSRYRRGNKLLWDQSYGSGLIIWLETTWDWDVDIYISSPLSLWQDSNQLKPPSWQPPLQNGWAQNSSGYYSTAGIATLSFSGFNI